MRCGPDHNFPAVGDGRRAGQARGAISASEVRQLIGNDHLVVRNPSHGGSDSRRRLLGLTDGGRALTIVIERTLDSDDLARCDRLELDYGRA